MNPVIESWIVIEKLAALCTTEGVSDDVKIIANTRITNLLNNVISPSLIKLSATQAGIITN